jgi:hypothetical protein
MQNIEETLSKIKEEMQYIVRRLNNLEKEHNYMWDWYRDFRTKELQKLLQNIGNKE